MRRSRSRAGGRRPRRIGRGQRRRSHGAPPNRRRTSSVISPGGVGVATSSPATVDPSAATTTDRWPRGDQGGVQVGQDLLGPADGVGADRGERVGDAQHRHAARHQLGAAAAATGAELVAGRAPVELLVAQRARVRRAAEVVRRGEAEPLGADGNCRPACPLRGERRRSSAACRSSSAGVSGQRPSGASAGRKRAGLQAAVAHVVAGHLGDRRGRPRRRSRQAAWHGEGGRVVVGVAALVRVGDDHVRPDVGDERRRRRGPGRPGEATSAGRGSSATGAGRARRRPAPSASRSSTRRAAA